MAGVLSPPLDLADPDLSVNFTSAKVSAEFAAVALQSFIQTGTTVHSIPLDSIEIFVPTDAEPPYTLRQLLGYGNRIGDIVFFMQIYEEDRVSHGGDTQDESCRYIAMLKNDPAGTLRPPMSADFAAKLVASWAIYAMVRAGPPSYPVPKFIKEQIGMDLTHDEMCEQFTSTPPVNWSLEWVRSVDWTQIGQETLSRFGLGVAGYRLIQPFKYYKPKSGSPPNIVEACALMEYIATRAAVWEVHPVTRDPNLLNTLGNVNKNCLNLMLEAFTAEQMAEMSGRSLSKKLVLKHDEQHINYRSWSKKLLDRLKFTDIF